MTIHVTAEDIEKGARYNPCFCPIALACKRELRRKRIEVLVGFRIVRGHGRSWKLPERAAAVAAAFDNNEPVSPFSFELEVPE